MFLIGIFFTFMFHLIDRLLKYSFTNVKLHHLGDQIVTGGSWRFILHIWHAYNHAIAVMHVQIQNNAWP